MHRSGAKADLESSGRVTPRPFLVTDPIAVAGQDLIVRYLRSRLRTKPIFGLAPLDISASIVIHHDV